MLSRNSSTCSRSRPAKAGFARERSSSTPMTCGPASSRFVKEQGGRGELAQAIEQAITDAGMKPVNLGRLPTPALTSYALTHGKGSMMITGSHIPFERNGYKTNSAKGELLKKDEAPINAARRGGCARESTNSRPTCRCSTARAHSRAGRGRYARSGPTRPKPTSAATPISWPEIRSRVCDCSPISTRPLGATCWWTSCAAGAEVFPAGRLRDVCSHRYRSD